MRIPAVIVEAGELLDVVLYAFCATVGVAVLFSLAILGLARASEHRLQSRGSALAYGMLALLCLAGCAAAAAYGLALLASK